MVVAQPSKSAEVRARLSHPVIDADGHTVELPPIFLDYLKQVGGGRMVDWYIKESGQGWAGLSPEERRDTWATRPPWWGTPSRRSLDRATASLPRLLYERLDELGIDFAVLYPTQGLVLYRSEVFRDEELRRTVCRAYNTFAADVYGEYGDRMTLAGVVPMHTPQEAIEELEFAVNTLGLKAVTIAGYVPRPIPKVSREHPDLDTVVTRLDTFVIDSEYDYDPFWAKCVELKVAPGAHHGGMGWGSRRSISNYMYNHIGHFAAASEALCKSLFMGGVTKRFPTLKVAFLECGVGWACSLYADLVGHWEKRNAKAIQDLDPANLDRDHVMELVAQYGGEKFAAILGEIRESLSQEQPKPPIIDEWAPCRIERAEEIRDLFEPHFYFGCEADDPMSAWAFNTKVNPFGARLRAMLSSDMGHWDVPDMREVVAEAYGLVERGLLTEGDFREFAFTNAVRLYGGMNREFFVGTRCEAEAAKILKRQST